MSDLKAAADSRSAMPREYISTRWAPLALLALATLVSYSPLLFGGGWFSDDYMSVYGHFGAPLPTLEASVRSAGAGEYSVARTFSHAMIGYGGWFLGEFGAMALRMASHALNGILFFLLLSRLPFARPVALGAALIWVTTPWHTQAVVWWVCVHLGFSITFILLALLVYELWLRRGAWWRLLLAQVLVFASLMTYEQALASWLVFFGVALLQPAQIEDLRGKRWMRALWKALAVSWPMLIPFALWAGLYLLTYPLETNARTPKAALDRNLVALASTHLRWFDSLYRIPWVDLWRQGLASITLVAAALMGILALAAARLLGLRREQETALIAKSVPLVLSLVFAYLLFAGFRLVFVMQGATSTETRNTYGANMGVALAIAAVAYFVLASKLRRPAMYALVVTAFCLAHAVVSRGEAWHVARNVQDERTILEKAVAVLEGDPQADALAVVVTKPLTNGEKDFYEEGDGGWLEYRLQKKLGRKIEVAIRRDGTWPEVVGPVVELK
jgi:hypothetical protein